MFTFKFDRDYIAQIFLRETILLNVKIERDLKDVFTNYLFPSKRIKPENGSEPESNCHLYIRHVILRFCQLVKGKKKNEIRVWPAACTESEILREMEMAGIRSLLLVSMILLVIFTRIWFVYWFYYFYPCIDLGNGNWIS